MDINNVLDKVNEVGMYMFPDKDIDEVKELKKSFSNRPGISYFVVKNLKSNKYRLCVKKHVKGYLDFKKLSKQAVTFYKNGEYFEALQINLKMLYSLYGKPKEFLIISIGMCYLKLGYVKTAISYLELGTLISSNNMGNLDYTPLINKLKGIKNVEYDSLKDDQKPFVGFSENEFKENVLTVRKMDEVFSLINNGDSIKLACSSLGLSYYEYLKVLLIIAREYYYMGEMVQGDKLLNLIKKDKNKDSNLIGFIKEIETNKKFYKFREESSGRKLIKRNLLN